jgi:hypothetical protein
MSAILNSLLTVDWSRVPAKVMEGLKTGKMDLSSSNGSVYWAAGSGATGKVQDLPLVPVNSEELASAKEFLQVGQAVNGAKVAAVSATAIGTAVVVVAVVVATAYLADKIDKVGRSVDGVAKIVGQQDQREYLKDVSSYTGAIMAASELLQSRAPQEEIAALSELKIHNLSDARHKTLSYIRHLTQLVSSHEGMTAVQYDLALQFMSGVLDLIPSAIAVERELCLAACKPTLAKECYGKVALEFREVLAAFRASCDDQYLKLALGKGGFADVLVAHKRSLNGLFNSPVHDLLLGDCNAAFVWDEVNASTNPEIMESDATDSSERSRSS